MRVVSVLALRSVDQGIRKVGFIQQIFRILRKILRMEMAVAKTAEGAARSNGRIVRKMSIFPQVMGQMLDCIEEWCESLCACWGDSARVAQLTEAEKASMFTSRQTIPDTTR